MRDKYIPSEELVRSAYLQALSEYDPDEMNADFDRFIAKTKATALRKEAQGLSWFGAQGNTLDHLSAWGVVSTCMKSIRDSADLIEEEAGMTDDPQLPQLSGGVRAVPNGEGKWVVHYRGIWDLEHEGPLTPMDILNIQVTINEILGRKNDDG